MLVGSFLLATIGGTALAQETKSGQPGGVAASSTHGAAQPARSAAQGLASRSTAKPTNALSTDDQLEEQHPGNFIFLIDVSGSMLFKKEMVRAADGTEVTLFEALRQALKQIVSDERLISTNSKVAFITFGTTINDKPTWPDTLKNSDVRNDLLAKISSADELQADKHGDTYMGGALDKAYEKATKFAAGSEPCATTFIIMLTDGWDEPPRGATLPVRVVAQKIVDKQKEIKHRLGVNTWQTRVVGLQRLPDRKAGTTTAEEVAHLLGGEFLDVAQQGSGTVADRIAAAIKKTIRDLQGRVILAGPTDGGVAAFGVLQGGADSNCNIRVNSSSCYGEQLLSVSDQTNTLSPTDWQTVRAKLHMAEQHSLLKNPVPIEQCIPLSNAPSSAITFHIKDGAVPLAPAAEQTSKDDNTHRSNGQWQPLDIVAHVDRHCPPGNYIGALKMTATAHADDLVPFFIAVPARLVTSTDTISAKIRKTGFFRADPARTEMKFEVNAQIPSEQRLQEEISVEPQRATTKQGDLKFETAHINGGKPAVIRLNTAEAKAQPVTLAVDIPAEQMPGKYDGVIKLRLSGASKALAPADVHYSLDILPSPWEEVRPVAIPIGIIFAIFVVLGIWLSLALRR